MVTQPLSMAVQTALQAAQPHWSVRVEAERGCVADQPQQAGYSGGLESATVGFVARTVPSRHGRRNLLRPKASSRLRLVCDTAALRRFTLFSVFQVASAGLHFNPVEFDGFGTRLAAPRTKQ